MARPFVKDLKKQNPPKRELLGWGVLACYLLICRDAERFHRTLNEKCVVGMYPKDSLDTLQYKLTLFLQYYNY